MEDDTAPRCRDEWIESLRHVVVGARRRDRRPAGKHHFYITFGPPTGILPRLRENTRRK